MLLVWAPETFHRRRATWGTSKTCCRLAVSAWGSSRRSWTLASAQLQACSLSPMEAFSLLDRKSTRLNSSHLVISYAVFCLKKKKELFKRLPRSVISSISLPPPFRPFPNPPHSVHTTLLLGHMVWQRVAYSYFRSRCPASP